MKDYNEEDFLMLSGIQHYKFCKRQWALIHIENQWVENYRTFEGAIIHEKAHDNAVHEKRNKKITSHAMPVHSRTMGVSGECDIVEFVENKDGIAIFGRENKYKLYPVEYKRGSHKSGDEDISQLVAQTICLEEMFCTNIDFAYLYYNETKHRLKIEITEEIRQNVRETFEEMHSLFDKKHTPKVKSSKACNACSLKDICLPFSKKSATDYINKSISTGEIS